MAQAGRYSSTRHAVVNTAADPMFAAIAAHRAAYKAYIAALEAHDVGIHASPCCARRAKRLLDDARVAAVSDSRAFERLLRVRSATPAGLRALLAHLSRHFARGEYNGCAEKAIHALAGWTARVAWAA